MLSGRGKFTVTISRDGKTKFGRVPNNPNSISIENGLTRTRSMATASTYGGGRHTVTASSMPAVGLPANAGGFDMVAGAVSTRVRQNILEGFLNPQDLVLLRKLYRDIYYYDPVAGGIVDLMSTLPFSEFTLSGVEDPDRLRTYVDSIEASKIPQMLSGISAEQLAIGEFLGVFHFEQNKRIFDELTPFNLDFADLIFSPLYGEDPIVDLRFTEEDRRLFNAKDVRIKRMMDRLPEYIREGISKGRIGIDPSMTLFITRGSLATNRRGVSYYSRVLPIYLLEKALIRGTIEQAQRRQRAILWAKAGDEDWEPDQSQLSALSNMIMEADMDPINAVIVTRNGVEMQEIKQGGDFWKYEDIYEFSSSAKLKALGANEDLLSGTASYNTLEQALSVFVDQLRVHRDNLTRQIFYRKLFPNIAVANDFRKGRNAKTEDEAPTIVVGRNGAEARIKVGKQVLWDGVRNTKIIRNHNGRVMAYVGGALAHDVYNVEDLSDYEMPELEWAKNLKPHGDASYMEMLDSMTQKGVPVPLRAIAAAGGGDLNEYLDGLDQDVKDRQLIQEKMGALQGAMGGMEGGFGDQQQEAASLRARTRGMGRLGVKLRNYDEGVIGDGYRTGSLEDGKPKRVSKAQAARYDERMNRMIAKVAARMNDKEIAKAKDKAFRERMNKPKLHYDLGAYGKSMAKAAGSAATLGRIKQTKRKRKVRK